MRRALLLTALLLTAAGVVLAQVRGHVGYAGAEGDELFRVGVKQGGASGVWNGHDFVVTVALDNGHWINSKSVSTFVADSLGGTVDLNISEPYAGWSDSITGSGGYLTAAESQAILAAGHTFSPQGRFKPWESDAGDAWDHGYASHISTDSIAIDVDRAWMATRLGVDESTLKGASFPYGYMTGAVYMKMQDEGYSWGRTFRENDWAFISSGWPTGFSDSLQTLPPTIGNRVINLYAIGGADSVSYVYGEGDSLSYAQVIERVEQVFVQPAIADGSYHIAFAIHGEPYIHRYKWILNYLDENYDCWFTDFTTLMEWWTEENGPLYPRTPPANQKGSMLAGCTAADSVWWAATPDPSEIGSAYIFSNSSTATFDTTETMTHTRVNNAGETLQIRASAPTTTYNTTTYCVYHAAPMPLDGGDRFGALYFDCATTLAGETIVSATLHWRTDWVPQALTFGQPATKEQYFHGVTAITDEDFAEWVDYGTGASSYTNVNQATATAWGTALDQYADLTDIGVVTWQHGSWDTASWYSADVTHGVQAWADGEPEGGFLFFGFHSSAQMFAFHGMASSATVRPYLVVYTE